MIQRVQTLYMLVVVSLMALAVFLPVASFTAAGDNFTLYAFALADETDAPVQPTTYMGIVFVLAALLPVVTIFLFKHRLTQIRLCVSEMVLLAGAIVMEGAYFYLCYRLLSAEMFFSWRIGAGAVMPVVCIIFDVLALRGVARDIKLLRDADRIR